MPEAKRASTKAHEVARFKPTPQLKAIIPAVGWYAIFRDEEPTTRPLVCWALVSSNVMGMYAYQDGVFVAEQVGTFTRYEYHPEWAAGTPPPEPQP